MVAARVVGVRLPVVDVERRAFRSHRDVVVLVDASLEALSAGAYRACTHDVAKGDAPRLSLVYELRPAMDVARAILAGRAGAPPD